MNIIDDDSKLNNDALCNQADGKHHRDSDKPRDGWTARARNFYSDLLNEFTKYECLTGDWEEQPEWLRDNIYLRDSHRRPTYSYVTCARSMFQLHTETVNIWTHLLGGVYFGALCAQLLVSSPTSIAAASTQVKLVLGLFLLSATACHLMSTFYHIFKCHSEPVMRMCSCVDYSGILLLITFSVVPWIWFALHDQTPFRLAYTLGTLTLGAFAFSTLLDTRYSSEPSYRLLRLSVFSVFALSGFIPAVHWYALHQHRLHIDWALRASLIKLITMYTLYTMGTLLYALRIPERYLSGRCDVWCHSHQFFHIFVSAATLAHFEGLTILASISSQP